MTPRQENSIERAVGRIEAQLEGLAHTLSRLTEKAEEADEWRHEVRERLERAESRGAQMTEVASAFSALQQSIRDGKMQAKGIVIGIGVAAGAGGATLATGLKAFFVWLIGDAA
jgi:predicted RNase H-like nuclease (RuvC/YqgF family)